VTENLLRDFVIVAYLKSVEQILSRSMACSLDIWIAILLENVRLDFQHFLWSTASTLTQALTLLTSVWDVPSSNLGGENGCPF
jgi:hypothetical protein